MFGGLFTLALTLALSGCDWFPKTAARESIFDKVVNIPKELVLDIPNLPPLCDELPGLKRGFADILGGKLYYEEDGQGIPLVLINGGPGCTHHGFHPYFSQIKDVARIIYYDQRGTGKSSYDDTGTMYTVKQAVEDLESLRKALKIDRWMVLGWSYGGLLAQCYALTYPQCCTGLILGAAETGLSSAKVKPEIMQMFISPAEQDAIKNIGKMVREGKITKAQGFYNMYLSGEWKHFYYYKPPKEEFIRALIYGGIAALGMRTVMMLECKKIHLEGKFDDFEIPTLITEAKWDLGWLDPDRAEAMRKNHPHAQVEIFEKSGHNIFADEPEKFFPLLRNFLEKSSKAQIVYKLGNRLSWPTPHSELVWKSIIIEAVPDKTEKERLALDVYKQAIAKNCDDAKFWHQVFWIFYWNKQYADKALDALQRYETLAKTQAPEELRDYGHCINVWRGQVLDLAGRRDEAVKCYQDLLHNFTSTHKYCPYVDQKWLEDRIKTPFNF